MMRSLVVKFQKWQLGRPNRGRHFQERLDLEKGAFFLSFKKQGIDFNSDNVIQSISNKTFGELSLYVRNLLGEQTKPIFKYIHEMGGDNPYPPTELIEKMKLLSLTTKKSEKSSRYFVSMDTLLPNPQNKEEQEEERIEEEEDGQYIQYLEDKMLYEIQKDFKEGKKVEHPDGFRLQIRKSNIDHRAAGHGVFVEGTITPGTVIGLYPGTIYYPQTLTREVIKNNEYLISRFDNVILDGRQWHHVAMKFTIENLASGKTGEKNLNRFRNPYGIGNFINHPNKGKKPNCMNIPYNFPSFESDPNYLEPELSSYIPNIQGPKSFAYLDYNCLMPSLLIVATEHIKDEELFLNYRFNPNNPYPDWFEQPDDEAAKRRWGKPKLFPTIF